MKINDEKKIVVLNKIMSDRKEQDDNIKNSDLTVIPKFVMKEDDDNIEEFKTPSHPKFMISSELECPAAPKKKNMKGTTSIVLFQLRRLCFFESLCEKFSRTKKKQKRS